MKLTKYLSFALLAASLTACGDDFLTDMPSGTVTGDQIENAAKDDPEGILGASLQGCYANWNMNIGMSTGDINEHMSLGFGGIMMVSDVMSNDISLAMGSGDPWHFDRVLDYYAEQYIRSRWPWGFFYTIIKGSNEIIGMINPDDTTDKGKYMLGQALAFRGISFAYLAQFYQRTYAGKTTWKGEQMDNKDLPCVPLLLSEKEESVQGRASVGKVYGRAEKDLLDAINYLDGFNRTTKMEINKQVAQGLLSRVYLVMNKYTEAAQMAEAAMVGYPLNDLNGAADWNYQDMTNGEAMWGFIPSASTTGMYASWASWHSTDGPGYGGYGVGAFQLIDAKLYNSMPDADVRKQLFVAPGEKIDMGEDNAAIPEYANIKFPFVAQWLGNVCYMRASEMQLNAIEGYLKSGNQSKADELYANFMQNRVVNWTPVPATADRVYLQRRLELWGEGFGYFDCRRLKKDLDRTYEGSNEPAGTQVKIPFSDYRWTYQLPLSEIRDNEAITQDDQNPLENLPTE